MFRDRRPSNISLLANLLSCEKEYANNITALVDSGQTSVNAFLDYIPSSQLPASHAVVSVISGLEAANKALVEYARSVEGWCAQLKELKELEMRSGWLRRIGRSCECFEAFIMFSPFSDFVF